MTRTAASLLAATALSIAGPALAADDSLWSGKLVLASDYISKGTSKNGDEPVLQGELAYDFGPLTAGIWGSNADTPQGAEGELQAYLGGGTEVGVVTLDFRATAKTMPGTEDDVQDDWLELRAEASGKLAGTELKLKVEYTPDNYAATEAAWWVEAQASRKIAEAWKVSAAYGVREQDGGADYRAWNAGVTWKATDRLALDLRWYDTDSHERGENYDGRVHVAATVAF